MIGIGVYRKSDYEEILKMSVDSSELDNTWEEWKANKERTKKHLQSLGMEVIDVLVTPEELLNYCRENVLRIDGNARSQFVSNKTSQLQKKK
ncbi:MAG TPA: hypothetical protein DCS93_30220 [Microscillaceae bacterium]|nr:hypothetical protein [Microscillaceae bacterium]